VIPGLDASKYKDLTLTFDSKQFYKYNPTYGNFRVLVNGEAISSTYTVQSDGDEVWNEYTFDLSAYDRTIFSLTFEANTKYDETGVNLDNINISGVEDTISFTADILASATCEEIEFTAIGNAPVTSYSWDFGDNAVPATANGVGPHIRAIGSKYS
jgi:PKD repeat protein